MAFDAASPTISGSATTQSEKNAGPSSGAARRSRVDA